MSNGMGVEDGERTRIRSGEDMGGVRELGIDRKRSVVKNEKLAARLFSCEGRGRFNIQRLGTNLFR